MPLLNGLIGVLQRYLSSQIGEGIIYDLRRALSTPTSSGMSLRFFTNTKTGELMSRLNNDVVGAQRRDHQHASSSSISNASGAGRRRSSIMLALEWRLTLLGIAILPLFILPARRVGDLLRRIDPRGDDAQRPDERA